VDSLLLTEIYMHLGMLGKMLGEKNPEVPVVEAVFGSTSIQRPSKGFPCRSMVDNARETELQQMVVSHR
jgi:hypothetical protein